MTAAQLIKKLQKLSPADQKRKVVLASDAEGNCFELLEEFTLEEVELNNCDFVKNAIILWPN